MSSKSGYSPGQRTKQKFVMEMLDTVIKQQTS